MHLWICFHAVSLWEDFLFHIQKFFNKKIQLENHILLQKLLLAQEHN